MPKTNKSKKKTRAPAPYPKPRATMSKRKSVPAAVSRSTVTKQPIVSRRNNSIVIRHAEYFEPVGTPGGTAGQFWVDTFAINPGNTSVFPWLSTQAFAWERYRFLKLHFRYVPRVPTSQAGTLVLSPDYDADDDAPPNELVACSYVDAVTCAPWQEITLKCNPEAMLGGMKTKYVRVGELKKNNDIKMYDACNLFVCRDSANSTAVTWGKLWVEYEIELITPHTIPTPLTSTYVGIGVAGFEPNYPVAPENSSIVGNVIDKAGPLSITDNGDLYSTGASGWKISGLIPGARYILQVLCKTGGPSPWENNMLTPILDAGLTLIKDFLGSHYYTATAAGKRFQAHNVIVQATEATALLRAAITGSLLQSAQLLISPIVSDTAFTQL